jgi:hypothetical protein
VFSEYLLSGKVPSVKEVNNEEPLFFNLSLGGSHKVSQCYFSIVQLTMFFYPDHYISTVKPLKPPFTILIKHVAHLDVFGNVQIMILSFYWIQLASD